MVEDMADRALQEGGRYPLPSDGAIIEMADVKELMRLLQSLFMMKVVAEWLPGELGGC